MQIRRRTIGASDGDIDKTRGDCKKFMKCASVPRWYRGAEGFVDRSKHVVARGLPSSRRKRERERERKSRRRPDAHATRTADPPRMRLCHGVSPPFPRAPSISPVPSLLKFQSTIPTQYALAEVCISHLFRVTKSPRRPVHAASTSFVFRDWTTLE
jgi:hypothetical protein